MPLPLYSVLTDLVSGSLEPIVLSFFDATFGVMRSKKVMIYFLV